LLRAQPPVDPKYVEAIVGNYSWYDSSNAAAKLGYHIRPLEESLGEAVQQARTRMVGTHLLNLKAAAAPSPAVADSDDLLLVTGAPGWLGNRLVDVLINGDRAGRTYPPRRVRLLVHPSNRELLKLPPNFEIVYCDITDKAAVRRALDGVRSVFHLAGAIWPSKVETLYRVNVEGTKAVADACVEAGVRRLLYMSTDSTCGHGTKEKRVFDEHTEARPYRDYGQSKRTAEEYLLAKAVAGQLDVTILRGFWFFGPYAPERQLGFLKMFWWPRQIVFGDGRNLRSISHIDNVVDAFLAAEKNTATFGKWYWLGDAEGGRTVDQVYQTVADAVGRPFRPLHVPVLICRMLNVVDLVLSKCGRIQPTIYSAGKFHFDIAGRSDAAMRDFGYTPRATLQDAAREMMEMAPPC
jgi:nucleoside-diphosphate-sugar epimerase